MTTVNHFKNSEEFVSYKAGEIIFQTGEEGAIMFAVQEGEVEIMCGETVLETVGAGGIFGEMSLIEAEYPRSATAVAKTDTRIVPVDHKKFLYLVHETPTFALRVMQIMAERIRHMNEMV